MQPILFKQLDNPITSFECVSDIQYVIDGIPPKDPSKLWMDASKCSYGFGNGAIESVNALGEAVLCNGIAYTKSADHASSHYYQLVTGQKYMSSWVFSLSLNPTPQWIVSTKSPLSEPLTLEQIYQIIFDKLKKPFVVAGVIHFSTMKETAIAKAPIENKKIFEHMDVYYPNNFNLEDTYGAIVGLVANIPSIADSALSKAIQKVVYFNPLEKGKTTLTTHEHTLILNKKIDAIENVTQNDVKDVGHLLTDSVIKSMNLNIYEVEPGSIILK